MGVLRAVQMLQLKTNGSKSVPNSNAMDMMVAKCTLRAPEEKSLPWQNAKHLARAHKDVRVYLTSRVDGAPTGARLAKRQSTARRWLSRSGLPLSRSLSLLRQLVSPLGPKSVPNWNVMDMMARCTSRAPEDKYRPLQNAKHLARKHGYARVYLTSRADGAATGARLAKSRGGTRRWLSRSG